MREVYNGVVLVLVSLRESFQCMNELYENKIPIVKKAGTQFWSSADLKISNRLESFAAKVNKMITVIW